MTNIKDMFKKILHLDGTDDKAGEVIRQVEVKSSNVSIQLEEINRLLNNGISAKIYQAMHYMQTQKTK